MAQCSQAKAMATELGFCSSRSHGIGALSSKNSLSFACCRKRRSTGIRFTPPMAVQADTLRSVSRESKSYDAVKLFVGLPLDVISNGNTISHPRAITAGLKALKLLGIEGVELPVWWGVVEGEAMGHYDWSGYLALAEIVQKAGLKLNVSLCFHGSERPGIPLPKWVSEIGKSDPDIFFTDYNINHFKECLSLAVDEVPVLDGVTPIQVYRDFCESFKTSFLSQYGSIVKDVSIGLGPDGELWYPSEQMMKKENNIVPGVGEFQCYDKYILKSLKHRAGEAGQPLWGLAGPHDAPTYGQSPNSTRFFNNEEGSWESPYAEFFLSWYSDQLLNHADRVLSMAASVFQDTPVNICGKLPLVHSWYNTRSHAAELLAGFYNTCYRDGYDAVSQIFAKHSCKMILPGMDLSDENLPAEACSKPETLLRQIVESCHKHGVEISGQNATFSNAFNGFRQIQKSLTAEKGAHTFTYQRMGEHFFSPEHFPVFNKFVRNLSEMKSASDDLIDGGNEDFMVPSFETKLSSRAA